MLKSKLLHPQILQTLAASGHFSKVLVADGNFPVSTMSDPRVSRVYLNLMPDCPTVTQVLEALVSAAVFQAAWVIQPTDDSFRSVHKEYRALLPPEIEWEEKERWTFYEEVRSQNTALVIATADTRRFANLLLTIGVRTFPGGNHHGTA